MILLGMLCITGILILPVIAEDSDHLAYLQLVGFLSVAILIGVTVMFNML